MPSSTGEKPDTITFLCASELAELLPEPEPAGKCLPSWFQDLQHTLGGPKPPREGVPVQKALTMKACMPANDAFSLGWMLVLPVDVEVACDAITGQTEFRWDPEFPFELVGRHHPAQVGAPGPPFYGTQVSKWMNPWRIVTPPGWSVLLTQPFNHFELPFQVFSGVVDVDRFAPLVTECPPPPALRCARSCGLNGGRSCLRDRSSSRPLLRWDKPTGGTRKAGHRAYLSAIRVRQEWHVVKAVVRGKPPTGLSRRELWSAS